MIVAFYKIYLLITGKSVAWFALSNVIALAEHILNGEKEPDLYETGPCSKAEIRSDRWEEK